MQVYKKHNTHMAWAGSLHRHVKCCHQGQMPSMARLGLQTQWHNTGN